MNIDTKNYEQLLKENQEFRDALIGMIHQHCSIKQGMFFTDFISANEVAFEVLGYEDRMPAPEYMLCDEPGCLDRATCGFPAKDGYRRTCGKHWERD